MLHQDVWGRVGMRSAVKRREIADKESQRWLTSLAATQAIASEGIRVVTIADREADIYELFAHPRRPNSEFLIRAAQNCNIKEEPEGESVQPLFAAIRQVPVQGEFSLAIERTPRRAARTATLTVRLARLWLQPPAEQRGISAIGLPLRDAP